MGTVESKFFQFLCTPDQLKEEPVVHEDARKLSGPLPSEVAIIAEMLTNEGSREHLKKFNPNKKMGPSPFKDTPLTYSVRYQHHVFLKECLQRGGDPFVANGLGDMAFHIACTSPRSSRLVDRSRKDILQLLLERPKNLQSISKKEVRLAELAEEEQAKQKHPSVGLVDKDKNTPLHLASYHGLLECVQLLLAYGAPVLVKNSSRKTPCDLASDQGQVVIVKLLESKMYFIGTSEVKKEDANNEKLLPKSKSLNIEMSPQEVVALKQGLIKQLKRDLHIPPRLQEELEPSILSQLDLRLRSFAVELLLVHFNWSVDTVMAEWQKDPLQSLKNAGITLDPTLFAPMSVPSLPVVTEEDLPPFAGPLPTLIPPQCRSSKFQCVVCLETCFEDERAHGLRCQDHKCCSDCFMEYIGGLVGAGTVQGIQCPGSGCAVTIPASTVERYMPADVKEKYRRFGLAAFVDAHDKTKWCPRKGCEKVVTYPPPGCVVTLNSAVNVECEEGHTFCWACLKEPGHEPLPCELWKHWQETIDKFHQGKLPPTAEAILEANTTKWIANNTKPCPKCSVSIQKNSGCNHMTCYKCHYDFCWVCLKNWRNHSDYFQCHYVTEIMLARQDLDTRQQQARKRAQEIAAQGSTAAQERFAVLHGSHTNQLENMALEVAMLNNLDTKLAEMAKMATILEAKVNKVARISGVEVVQQQSSGRGGGGGEDRFLFTTYGVLIRSRPVLAASYALSYFLPDHPQTVCQHLQAQGKVMDAAEELADLVARERLKAPLADILKAAVLLAEACESYVSRFLPLAEECALRLRERGPEVSAEQEAAEQDSIAGLYQQLVGNQTPTTSRRFRRMVATLQDYRLEVDASREA